MMLPGIALALHPVEQADFLPPDLYSRLQQLPYSFFHEIPLPLNGNSTWPEVLLETRAEVLISGWETPPLPPDFPVGKAGQLHYVCHLAGTVRKLVPRSLIERGLVVTNWGSSIGRTVAECTLLLMLSALRRSSHWAIAMHREGQWKDRRTVITQSLLGRSVGIHGFGAIARDLVPMIKPFGGKISAFSPSVPDALLEAHGVTRAKSLEELFSENDVIVELAAYTKQNHHIVTEEILRCIRPGGVFVNVGRGAVVDETALVRVAREGNIQIALDVYEVEPLPIDSGLRGLPNVTLLPHLGGPTKDRRRDCGLVAVENLKRYLTGSPLEGEVTLEVYDRAT